MVSAVAGWVMVQPLATFAATTVTGGAALAPSRAAVLTMVSRSMSIPETDQGQAGRLGRFGQLDGQAGGQMGAVGRQARVALQRGFHHAARGAQLAHAQLVQRFVFTGNGQHQARSLCAGSAGAAVCSSALASLSVRAARSWLPWAISALARATLWACSFTLPTTRVRPVLVVFMASSKWPISS